MTGPVEAESMRAPSTAVGRRRPGLLSEGELLLVAVFFLTALTSIAVTPNSRSLGNRSIAAVHVPSRVNEPMCIS